ncbi:hypothetical protein, variant [Cryptococcus amylolentus CBS 6039]|uniref:ubiquitinyl hydrolase 1 n=1 Tax=Cryptococcus amylolentus CBS 6039 TaxID=1295533 RepID=A0A1E3I149_9TREE|nr:hypothetical protein, variant [Cryptococcus amylolentus CBS 6039]ODN82055.1 hypothetical protein, variant [Cryptococcus amylolentus CBS 6039]
MATTTTMSTPTPLFSRPDSSICDHLSALLKSPAGPNSLDTNGAVPGPSSGNRRSEVEGKFVRAVNWGAVAQGAKRRKTAAPECGSCRSSMTRPWACLTCSYVGCLQMSGRHGKAKDCMKSHLKGSSGRCGFAVDPPTGSIFCFACNDTIYPDSFDSLFLTARVRVEEGHDRSSEPGISGGKGRSRGPWKPWNSSNMVGVDEKDISKTSCRGLRPLLNLSQTCFLSAVLQALIHNPLLKAYFLSDKHNRHVCGNGSRGLLTGKPFLGVENGPGQVGGDREKGCMCCEMDKAFEEFYKEDKSPFGPITMLYSMWHASTELEGHGQQDAHSFFLAALDQMHAHAKGQLSSCNCIARKPDVSHLASIIDSILRPNIRGIPAIFSDMFQVFQNIYHRRPHPRHPARLSAYSFPFPIFVIPLFFFRCCRFRSFGEWKGESIDAGGNAEKVLCPREDRRCW